MPMLLEDRVSLKKDTFVLLLFFPSPGIAQAETKREDTTNGERRLFSSITRLSD